MDVNKELQTYKWQTTLEYQRKWEKYARQAYKKHNAYVMATVPSDRLLVWNLKVRDLFLILMYPFMPFFVKQLFRMDGNRFVDFWENRYQMSQYHVKT